MGYAIIQKARSGHENGIDYLALVDRKKCRNLWWTSDNSAIMMRFIKKSAAEYTLKNLRYNGAEIVDFGFASQLIDAQEINLCDTCVDDHFLDCGDR